MDAKVMDRKSNGLEKVMDLWIFPGKKKSTVFRRFFLSLVLRLKRTQNSSKRTQNVKRLTGKEKKPFYKRNKSWTEKLVDEKVMDGKSHGLEKVMDLWQSTTFSSPRLIPVTVHEIKRLPSQCRVYSLFVLGR